MSSCDSPETTGQWTLCRVAFLAGMALTAVSMAAGFIWASQGELLLVYLAGFTCWSGYIIAHYGVTGVFIDNVESPEAAATEQLGDDDGLSFSTATDSLRGLLPEENVRAVGFLFGIAVFVGGVALLAWFVREENLLLATVGSGTFLAGYAIAHYFDSSSGHPL